MSTEEESKTWYLALCLECEPVFPQPFLVKDDRDKWAAAHANVHGRILLETEVRVR